MTRLTFHGAAETVTGSKYLLESAGARVLIDCGQFQGAKRLRKLNWERFPFDPGKVDKVVLTHAHIDHSGQLPRLVRSGYRGKIHCTVPTVDLLELLLLDSARNEESGAEYANRKGFSKHHPALPLVTTADVIRVLDSLVTVDVGKWFQAAGEIWMRYHDAGHLLGSAMIEVEVRDSNPPLRLVFSGDVGRYSAPLYHDPMPPPPCDYLICESTYGDRDHATSPVLDQLCELTEEAIRRGGVMLVASFAVGRAQQLIYLLQVLMQSGRLPRLSIYLDSPMAINATDIYKSHRDAHDLSEGELSGSESLLDGPTVVLARTTAESKQINQVVGPAVIISSSGMMVGGRILHHLKRRLPDPDSTVLLGGFSAAGTRARKLADGAETIRIHGRDVPVKAAVRSISGLSGHADRGELLRWLEPLEAPSRVFLTHGEPDAARSLAEELKRSRGWKTHVPQLGEAVDLRER